MKSVAARAISRQVPPYRWLRWLCAAVVLAGAALAAAAGADPKRVLIVHSFGREIAPYDAVIAAFRRELASRSPGPVVFMEAALDAGRAIGPDEQAAFVAYLRARFSHPAPDLIVGSSGPAARFLVEQRDRLFPGVPILLTAVDARVAPRAALKDGDALVTSTIEVPRIFDALLRVLPDTRTIAVVIGQTPLERFWRKELERDIAYLGDRVRLVWLDQLSLPQIKERVATLPPGSAVFYALLMVDGAGVPHERLDALTELKQVSAAPIFSPFESELGQGVIGGPYLSQSRVGANAAEFALQRLSGASSVRLQEANVGMDTIAYDARELRRWRIDPLRLPAGSELLFQTPSPWAQYRGQIIAAALVIVAQAGLITALLLQRARRRRAEQEARTLGGRLITAYEDEGRRLARELHDDVTQRLAGVSIEAATLGRLSAPAERAAAEQSISGELASLSRDVHALSYRLHPSVIDDLGLEEALRVECDRAARRGTVDVAFHCDAASGAIRGGAALCLFRVAQEALRNALRHAQAAQIRVELRPERGGTLLSVADDGSGFEPAAPRERASLGLASMRERIALFGGRLDIRSQRGQGTRVTAWMPALQVAP
jgi:signal transduction histidine kinase